MTQIPVQLLFYKKDGTGSGSGEVYDDGKIFYNVPQDSWSDVLYLRLPDNIPINVDSTYRVRLLQFHGQLKETEPVLRVEGDKVICGNFGIQTWSSRSAIQLVQFESYREESEELFYEVTDRYSISSNTFSTLSATVKGDIHRVAFTETPGECFVWSGWDEGFVEHGALSPYLSSTHALTKGKYWSATVYSQSPTCASQIIEVEEQTVEKPKKKSLKDAITGALTGAVVVQDNVPKVTSEVRRVYTSDYTKIVANHGHQFIYNYTKQENREPTTLTISEKYIPNSQVNGLNTFRRKNLYTISPTRSPIRKLQPVGDVLLAIHEKGVSSLYSNPQTGEITQDNHLSTRHGTTHPRSVVDHDGKVYFFSAHSNAICRYSNNGVVDLAEVYRIKNWLKPYSDNLLLNSSATVYAGFDPGLNMLFMTFYPVGVDPVTIGFLERDGSEGFIGMYSFVPLMYSKIGERMYGFYNGQMHEHRADGNTHNAFYGSSATSSWIKFVFNHAFNKSKILRSIAEESNAKWRVSTCTSPGGQLTHLADNHFREINNGFHAEWRRDENTNAALLSGIQTPFLHGKMMSDKWFEMTVLCTPSAETTLDGITIGFDWAPGQRAI